MMSKATNKENMADTKELSARLMAVQAYYQNTQNTKPVRQVVQEYLDHAPLVDVDGEALSKPQSLLFKRILVSLDSRLAEVDELVKANVSADKEVEPLLKAILMCGVCEILEHQDIDAPLIIDDYLNVTHAFYEKQQVALVNGMLDKISALVRS